MENKLFVLATTPMGLWVGKVTNNAYDCWFSGKGALRMEDVRSLNVMMDPDGRPKGLSIGPPYFGDTLQLNIDVIPTSVEIIGDVVEEAGTYRCTSNSSLFSSYIGAVEQWKTALGKITIAPAGSLNNIRTNPNPISNITQFPRKR